MMARNMIVNRSTSYKHLFVFFLGYVALLWKPAGFCIIFIFIGELIVLCSIIDIKLSRADAQYLMDMVDR